MELLDFYTDGPKHRDGVWVKHKGAELLIAPMDNPEYKAFTAKAKMDKGAKALSDEELRDLLEQAVAHTVLRGWTGITLDGQKVDYTPEYALQVFKALPEFLDTVVVLAYDEARFKEDEVEGVLEKLRPTSAGASSGAKK